VGAQKLLDEADNLRILRRVVLRPFALMNGAYGFERNTGFLRMFYVRPPFVLALELARDGERRQLDNLGG